MINYLSGSEREILGLLCIYPSTEFSYREIERKTGESIGTVSKYVKIVEKKELVKVRSAARAKFVRANTESQDFVSFKKIYNLEILHISGLIYHLNQTLHPDSIILFGSFSSGTDHEKSDIDIAVIHGRETELDLSVYEKKMNRRISLTRIKNIKKSSNEFKNTLANGIVLSGYIEVV
ncbi:MAG: nucleotidyltransferase domain-containing protein [Candidatus Aenigmatarchaeota archaeon]